MFLQINNVKLVNLDNVEAISIENSIDLFNKKKDIVTWHIVFHLMTNDHIVNQYVNDLRLGSQQFQNAIVSDGFNSPEEASIWLANRLNDKNLLV